MKIVAFLTLVNTLLVSSGVEGRRHNFRGVIESGDRDLKSKSGGSGSSSANGTAGGANRVVDGGGDGSKNTKKSGSNAGNFEPLPCMTSLNGEIPSCVNWPLDQAAANRATGPGIFGYTLSETVIDSKNGRIYRVYTPDDVTLISPTTGSTEDFLSDPNVNRVPTGGEEEVDGSGLMDPTPTVSTPTPGANRIPGSITSRTGSCSKSIPSIGDGLPENCVQGNDCKSGKCAVTLQVPNGVCVAEVPKSGWKLLPSAVTPSCVNK